MLADECTGFALHGVKKGPDAIAAFYDLSTAWFAEHGKTAGAIGAKAGFRIMASPGRRLVKTGFKGHESLELAAVMPGAVAPLYEYEMICSIHRGMVTFVASQSLVPPNRRSVIGLVREACGRLGGDYGYVYERKRTRGAALFPSGIGMNGLDDAAALADAFWGGSIGATIWAEGVLRDVFPLNVLTQPQLDRKLGAKTLLDWIRSDRRRGTIDPLDDQRWLWEVDPGERRTVRRPLWDAGILFNWPQHVEGAGNHPDARRVQPPEKAGFWGWF